ncbi:MAG TPA: fumarylacetoacetate hydrolase family protein [Vicinamibacterales bacterium]|nr:fumarylacetoacetate hydrolase family protein [Vicinamibacterales bacterium]
MARLMIGIVLSALLLAGGGVSAQRGASPAEPFKLGTFAIDGRPTVGVVLRDSVVVDLAAANRELEQRPEFVRLAMPADMRALIGQYEYGLKLRLYEIVDALVREQRLDRDRRPSFVHDLAKLRTMAPILYPSKILNAAGNYYGHVSESSTPEEQRKVAEARRKARGTPYLFLKPTLGAIVGNGDDIVLPRGRDKIDWECELAVVIGRPAKYVTAAQAKDYIFGYTIELDMSDRGGRPGETEPRSDWFVGKGHDTFAPMGPFIVPKEFFADPMNVRQTLTVNGKMMQDSRSSDMIHNIFELIEYGSSIMTLFPGDVISAGSPAGTGMSRSVRPEQVFLKAGDRIVATIDGIGTMTHTARAEAGSVIGTGTGTR